MVIIQFSLILASLSFFGCKEDQLQVLNMVLLLKMDL